MAAVWEVFGEGGKDMALRAVIRPLCISLANREQTSICRPSGIATAIQTLHVTTLANPVPVTNDVFLFGCLR